MSHLSRNRSKPFFLIILTGVCVILGISLRFSHIRRHVYWHDEVYTILRAFGTSTDEFNTDIFDGKIHNVKELQQYQRYNSQKTIRDSLRALSFHPEHSPLYYLLVRLIAPYFDPPVAGARLLSAFISLLLFPAVYLLTKELFLQSKSAPLIALCLIALSPIQILYAREARQYALYQVLVIFASFYFLKACRNDRSWRWYGVMLVMGLYTHLLFGLLILAHALILGIDKHCRSKWRIFFTSVGVSMGCFSPWIWVVFINLAELKRYTAWMYAPLPLNFMVSRWGEHLYHTLFDLPDISILKWISIPLVLFCFLFTLLKSDRQAALILGLTISVNVLFLIIPDLLSGGQRSMEVRYFLSALLFLQLCLVFFLSKLTARSELMQWVGYMGIIGLFIATATFGYRYINTDTWWNKNVSINNPIAARFINLSSKPLVITQLQANTPGEVLSLSYWVGPKTMFLTLPPNQMTTIPAGYDIFLFRPSSELERELRYRYNLSAVAETRNILWMASDRKSHQ
jgi:uncharacterized membrane protein